MEKTVRILQDMVKSGVIDQYAIGGAMALLFYMEPALTFDLDIFVFLPDQFSGLLTDLSPIYNYCRSKGYSIQREHIVIEGIAVQFIPVYNDLVQEAVAKAKRKKLGKVTVRVFGLEYLMAIMLQTGRPKDFARLTQACEEKRFDRNLLQKLIQKNGLENAWRKFKK